MPLILGTNSIKDTGYNVANSCRFNRADSPNLTKTPSSSGNLRKWTWSCWVKRGSISNGSQTMFNAGSSANNQIRFDSDDTINFYQWNSGYTARLSTNQKFRDVSAWYHIVAHWDTDNSTAGDRMKLFVNGTEVTSFATDTNPSQNLDSYFGASGTALYVGDKGDGAEEMDGYLAEVVFIDGQNLAPDQFGEFDSDSPTIWKPIDVSGLTFGTNGFYLDFEDSSNLGNDANGGTDFTENNITAIDQSTDTCTNNFATINPLFRNRFANQETLSEGNLKMTTGPTDGDKALLLATQGVTKGKWYWEVKVATNKAQIGVAYNSIARFTDFFGSNNPSDGFGVYGSNGNVYYDGTDTSYGSSWTTDDIIMVALDMDNHLCWLGKNGTWFDSATQSEIENSTATNDITTQMSTQQNLNSGDFVSPLFADMTGTGDMGLSVNFGSPPYAISSGNSDGNGYGNFEYAVPSSYYSLCTKNLAEYG